MAPKNREEGALIDPNLRNCTDLFPTKQLYREKSGQTLGTQDYFEPVSSGTGVCDILNGLLLFFALHATRGRQRISRFIVWPFQDILIDREIQRPNRKIAGDLELVMLAFVKT